MMSGNVHAAGITNYVAYRKRPRPVIKIHFEMMGDRQIKAAAEGSVHYTEQHCSVLRKFLVVIPRGQFVASSGLPSRMTSPLKFSILIQRHVARRSELRRWIPISYTIRDLMSAIPAVGVIAWLLGNFVLKCG
jgi:hypothetical protein